MKTLILEQVVSLLISMTHDLQAQKGYLIELDSAVGDGDLGITVDRGFQGVREGIANPPQDIGRLLFKAGVDFSNSAGSTMGALLGTAFMRAGKQVQGQTEIDLTDMVRMVKAAEDGIMEKGKAKPGDKTMLDAIDPARTALEQAAAEGATLVEALRRAEAAAATGVQATINMQAAFGRARWLGERTVGHQDPGATLVLLMLRSALAALQTMSQPRA